MLHPSPQAPRMSCELGKLWGISIPVFLLASLCTAQNSPAVSTQPTVVHEQSAHRQGKCGLSHSYTAVSVKERGLGIRLLCWISCRTQEGSACVKVRGAEARPSLQSPWIPAMPTQSKSIFRKCVEYAGWSSFQLQRTKLQGKGMGRGHEYAQSTLYIHMKMSLRNPGPCIMNTHQGDWGASCKYSQPGLCLKLF